MSTSLKAIPPPPTSRSLSFFSRVSAGGEAEEEAKEGLFKTNTVNEEGWRKQKEGPGLGYITILKKHPLSLGRRHDLNAKEIEINDDLVSPSDEDGAIFLHVLYMRLYCLYVTESKVKFLTGQTHFLTSTLLYSPLLSSTLLYSHAL